MKVAVLTLGCKVNKYESDALIFKLKEMGFEATDKLEYADYYVINTCAVTNEAERKSRQMVERCRKFNENAKIFIMGCASQNRPLQFGEKANFVQGVANKLEIIKHFEELGSKIYDLPTVYEDDLYSAQTLTRAFIKIQDGCNNFCTYCIIPYLRGRSRSRSIESVVKEVEKLPNDVKEIVLVGIDVSDYQQDGKRALIDLLERLDTFNKRLRLSSMEDNLITEDFVKRLSKLKNFCPHFHLSLQSGSDEVLKKMNRKYTTNDFMNSVKLIRKYFKNAGITTDVIAGFPIETEEDFKKSCEFIEKVEFSDLHIFPYSKREGTVASKIYKDLPKSIKNERVKVLEEIKKKDKLKFILQNDLVEILVEEEKGGVFYGYSKNYIKCKLLGNFQVGDIVKAKIVKPSLEATLCEKI